MVTFSAFDFHLFMQARQALQVPSDDHVHANVCPPMLGVY